MRDKARNCNSLPCKNRCLPPQQGRPAPRTRLPADHSHQTDAPPRKIARFQFIDGSECLIFFLLILNEIPASIHILPRSFSRVSRRIGPRLEPSPDVLTLRPSTGILCHFSSDCVKPALLFGSTFLQLAFFLLYPGFVFLDDPNPATTSLGLWNPGHAVSDRARDRISSPWPTFGAKSASGSQMGDLGPCPLRCSV
jgi:hypothetical protein